MALATGVSYLLSLGAVRLLPPAEFGGVGALIAVLLVASVPATAIQTVTALNAARPAGPDVVAVLSVTLRTAAAVGAAVAAAAVVLAPVLTLPIAALLWVAAATVPLTLLGMVQGLLQGRHLFGRLGGVLIASAALRSAGGLVGAALTDTATGTAAGIAAGSATAAALCWPLAGRLWRHAQPAWRDLDRSDRADRPDHLDRADRPGHLGAPDHLGRALASTLPSLLALYAFTNIDILAARAVLAPAESGAYAVGSLATKVAFWLPQSVPVVVLARIGAGAGRLRTVLIGTSLVGCCGLVLTLGGALLGGLVMRVLGGEAFVGYAPQVWRFAALGSGFAVVSVLLAARLASGDPGSWVLPTGAAVGQVVVILAGPATVEGVVSRALLVTAGAVLAAALVEVWASRRGAGQGQPGGPYLGKRTAGKRAPGRHRRRGGYSFEDGLIQALLWQRERPPAVPGLGDPADRQPSHGDDGQQLDPVTGRAVDGDGQDACSEEAAQGR